MQAFYLIIAVIVLVIWLGPSALIGIAIIMAFVLLAKSASNSKPAKQVCQNNNKFFNTEKKGVSSHAPKENYFAISTEQDKHLLSVIDSLMMSEDADIHKIISLARSFQNSYWEKRASNTSDLYDYILKAAYQRINSAKQGFKKKESEAVIRIVMLLKEGVSTYDIVRAILTPKEGVDNKSQEDITVIDIKENNNTFANEQPTCQEDNRIEVVTYQHNHNLRDKEHCRQLHSKVETLQQNAKPYKEVAHAVSQIINGLAINAIHREDKQAIESESSPTPIDKATSTFRKTELHKQKKFNDDICPTNVKPYKEVAHAVSQIINGLAINAIHREDKQAIESESSPTPIDKVTYTYRRTELPMQKKNNDDICLTKGVPYWGHNYVYSAADLQRANHQQKQFYSYFKAQFLKGFYVNINDNSNYAFVLMYDLADDYKKHKDYDLLKQQFKSLAENYPILSRYLKRTLSKAVSDANQEEAARTLQSYGKSLGQLCRWVTPGETVEVQGVKLTRGNFYIGECFRLPSKIFRDNSFYSVRHNNAYIYGSVLNPDLPASKSNDVSSRNAFCSYQDMSPAWRHEYLMWLSGKKQASDVPAEILLFYLYGCEIRMFIDQQANKAERRAMLSDSIELYRSLNFKSSDYVERELKQKLIDFIGNAIVKYFHRDGEEFNAKDVICNSSLYQNYYIAKKIAGKKTLTAEDAFDIANELFDIEGNVTPTYFSVARKLFVDTFSSLYKNMDVDFGYATTVNRSVCYYNNLSCFNAEKIYLHYKIAKIPSGLWLVHDALKHCYYWGVESKFRGYNRAKERSNGIETVAAIQMLPAEIDIRELPKIQTLVTRIENEMQAGDNLVKPLDWLLTLWEYERRDEKSLHKEYADSIIGGLRRLGFGIVPDYEVDLKRFNFGDNCVLYRNEEHLPVKSTTKYDRSDLFIRLAAHIVHTDKISNSDFIFVEQYLKSYNNTAGNQLHLMAVIRWRFSSKKRQIDKHARLVIEKLTSEQRTSMGNALIRLACIDGDIHPKRIDGLKKVWPLLGVDADNIHSQLHRLLTDSDGFAVVEKKSDATEFTINGEQAAARQTAASSIAINTQKLKTFELQTKAAQKLLSDIFEEEEATTPQNTTMSHASDAWADLLELLMAKEVWKRSEVEDMCKERGLMLGAVLEQINDFAYEKVDDAVIEDDGANIYVTLDYKNLLI